MYITTDFSHIRYGLAHRSAITYRKLHILKLYQNCKKSEY